MWIKIHIQCKYFSLNMLKISLRNLSGARLVVTLKASDRGAVRL